MNFGIRLTACMTTCTVLMACGRSEAQPKSSDDKALVEWGDKRIQAWQPTADEKRLDQITWAKDLRTAQKLAKENSRPLFLNDSHPFGVTVRSVSK